LPPLTVHRPNDDDWFLIQTVNTGAAENFVRIDFDGQLGNLGLALYDAAGNLLTFANSPSGNFEAIGLAGAPPGFYFLQVYGLGATSPAYQLSMNMPLAPQGDLFDQQAPNN